MHQNNIKQHFWKIYPPLTARCWFFHSVQHFLNRNQLYSLGPFYWKAFSLVMGNEMTLKKKKIKYPLKWVNRSHLFFCLCNHSHANAQLKHWIFSSIISVNSVTHVKLVSQICSKWTMHVHAEINHFTFWHIFWQMLNSAWDLKGLDSWAKSMAQYFCLSPGHFLQHTKA